MPKAKHVKKYMEFHGVDSATIKNEKILLPGPKNDTMLIGGAVDLSYRSDKWDGITRDYIHKLKKHGKIIGVFGNDSRFKTIIIYGVDLDPKDVGLTG